MIRALLVSAATLLFVVSANAQSPQTALSLPAQVGKQMFVDKTLSGSGRMSCASCHDPANHYAPANDLSVQLGGPKLNKPGVRAVPTLTYKDYTTAYADLADNPDGVSAPGPGGGFTWDGGAGTLAEQAKIPLLSPVEMANHSVADVVAKLKKSSYAPLFVQAFGPHAFDKPALAFARAMDALQAYQLEDPSFHPYSSKYDLYSSNKVGGDLTPAEVRGFAVFQDPNRGNCAACHFSGAGVGGSVAQFTDYSFSAIGVPRNTKAIAANKDAKHFDMGICSRADHPRPDSAEFCGMFKTPTLRNVATRKSFFHNGQIRSLEEAVRFYATRDSNPERWYPTVNGKVQKFNDLPKKYHGNIDTQMPLDGRAPGSAPPMNEQDIQDLLAFLDTLTDGYVPPEPPKPAAPSAEALAPVLDRYLAVHGEICVAKYDWPIDVSARDIASRTRDSIQMPVLERQGLVSSRDGYVVYRDDQGEESVPTKRYMLTEAGERFYKAHDVTLHAPGGGDGATHHRDLCAGQLELERIVRVNAPEANAAAQHVSVAYQYRFKAEPWVTPDEVRRVFPMLDTLLQGQGKMEMQQGFHLVGEAWVADTTLEAK